MVSARPAMRPRSGAISSRWSARRWRGRGRVDRVGELPAVGRAETELRELQLQQLRVVARLVGASERHHLERPPPDHTRAEHAARRVVLDDHFVGGERHLDRGQLDGAGVLQRRPLAVGGADAGQRVGDLVFQRPGARAQGLDARRLAAAQLARVDLAVAPVQRLPKLVQPAHRRARAGGARREAVRAERDQVGEAARFRLLDEGEGARAADPGSPRERDRHHALVDDQLVAQERNLRLFRAQVVRSVSSHACASR